MTNQLKNKNGGFLQIIILIIIVLILMRVLGITFSDILNWIANLLGWLASLLRGAFR